MAINWGALQPIQQGGVVAQVPRQQGALQQIGQVGSGIAAGLQQGQAIRANDQTIQMNDARLQQMEQNQQFTNNLSSAETEDQIKQVYYKSGKQAEWMDIQLKKAQTENMLAAATRLKGEAEGVRNKNYYDSIHILGLTSSAALKGQTPEQQQQIYDQAISYLPEHLQKLTSKTFDKNRAIGNILLDQAAMEQQGNASQRAVTPSDTRKRIDELNAVRQSAGQPPLSKEEEEKILQTGLNTSINPSRGQLSAGQQVAVTVTKGNLTRGQEEAQVARNINSKLKILEQLDNSENISEGSLARFEVAGKKGAAALGALFGINIPANTAASEAFDAISTDLQLDIQTKLKGATSERDMVVVERTVPLLDNTKEGRKLLYNYAQAINTAKIQFEDFRNEWAQLHNGSLVGTDEAWNKFLNSGSHVDSDTKRFKLDSYNRSKWKPFLDENYEAPTTSQFEEGKIYQDASGNKAAYQNGQWVEVN